MSGFNDLAELICEDTPEEVPVFLKGPPGIGKSALCQAVSAAFAKKAEAANRTFAFDRWELTVHQPEDLSGIPFAHDGWMRFCPPERLAPFCAGSGVNGTDPIGCLVFEDVTHASQAVKNGMLQLVQERTLGALVLSPDIRILMTGNRTSDKAGARDLLSALKNRVLVLDLQPNLEEWMLWAGSRGLPSVIGGFLSWKPGSFSTLPNSECKENGQFATPRSWANVGACYNKVFRNGSTAAAYSKLLLQTSGLIGQGHAHEFVAFVRLKEEYPDPKKILDDPENALPKPPTEADRVIALVTALGDYSAHHQEKDKAIYLKLLLALSHVSGKNREGCAAGVSVFQACGGDVAKLVDAADKNKKDGRVLAVLKFFAEATK